MTVQDLLSAKGGDVVSIGPTATLETAVKTLAKHRIGALPRARSGSSGARHSIRNATLCERLANRAPTCSRNRLLGDDAQCVVICGQTETCRHDHGADDDRASSATFRSSSRIRWSASISIGDVVKHRLREMEQEVRGNCATISKPRER